jgi:hypothetical protein
VSPRPDVVTRAAIAAAAAVSGQDQAADVEAALDQWAEELAGRVVDKLGQGFTLERQWFKIMSQACQGRNQWRISWGGVHEVYMIVTVIGDDRVELAIEADGGNRVWQGTLRPAP